MKTFMLFSSISPCGQKCKHCYAALVDKKKIYKTFQEVKHVIDEAAKLKEDKYQDVYMILNDDPFTHKDVIQILDYMKLKGVGILKWAITNGLALSKRKNANDIIKKYKEVGVEGIVISLFGLEKKHDEFVGLKGAYANAIKAIDIIKENKLDFSINLFLTSTNLEDVITLKKIYEGNVKIGIFSPSLLLENEENKKYWAKYKDMLILSEQKHSQSKIGSFSIKNYFSVKKMLEKINDDKFLSDNSKIYTENMWAIEINYNIYQAEMHTTLDKIGNLNFDSMKEIETRSSFFSYIFKTFYAEKPNKLRETLIKWSDENDEKVYLFSYLLQNCVRKDVTNSLRKYWNKLPIEKIQIFAEQNVNWNYLAKTDIFTIGNNSDSQQIKGALGQIISEMLKGSKFNIAIRNILGNEKESSDKLEAEFFEVTFELHKKGYIYLTVSE